MLSGEHCGKLCDEQSPYINRCSLHQTDVDRAFDSCRQEGQTIGEYHASLAKMQQFDKSAGYDLPSGTLSSLALRTADAANDNVLDAANDNVPDAANDNVPDAANDNVPDAANHKVLDAAYFKRKIVEEYAAVNYFLGILKDRPFTCTECGILEARLPYQKLFEATYLSKKDIETKIDDSHARLWDAIRNAREVPEKENAWAEASAICREHNQLLEQEDQLMLDYVEKIKKYDVAHTEAYELDLAADGLTKSQVEEYMRPESIAARQRRVN
jgi:hypothetical protein